ncbi:MAG: aminotransferase class I and II [Flavobacteriaceae bacterium]|uniref:Aminotransferase class I and II n=1 Tax=Flavobacterium kayseriense TaxID=2764714 RepID=A0ABR7J978_9FLAO|nr:HipA family kinase [Flavobacterium kayseriense]MBC5842060.1 aminotransferase class I and II [Flavobacterium kayseriense]MBC5848590.1 aminotransferase class I and II [Flavobacterium kayseriense]MBX9887896.1 aminotransferase class I and II [Flavobacteriaceae bacterium]
MTTNLDLRTVNVTRYITPLREGGSLPALAEADDDYKYVLKFKGAGHGVKALIAELLGGEIARVLKLAIPELVFANLDEAFGRTEADEEIQDLLQGSQGLNLALHFLSGAINFDPVVTVVDAKMASQIVWLDAYITNVDRTFRNTNMLLWHKELWLIDHGASFYFHHSWTNWEQHAKSPFKLIKDHVLLPQASMIKEADDMFKTILTPSTLQAIVQLIPLDWLQWQDTDESPEAIREVYYQFLVTRLNHSEIFINEAQNAREALI